VLSTDVTHPPLKKARKVPAPRPSPAPVLSQATFIAHPVDVVNLEPAYANGRCQQLAKPRRKVRAEARVLGLPPTCRRLDSVTFDANAVLAEEVQAPAGVPLAAVPKDNRSAAVLAMLEVRYHELQVAPF
jgi:hypothetical protein